MALTPSQQKIFDAVKNALPRIIFGGDRPEEITGAIAVALDAARVEMQEWVDNTYIDKAVSFWLNSHGLERNLYREAGESDGDFRTRIRNFDDALTRPVLLAGVNQIMSDNALPNAVMLEVRRDKGFWRDATSDSGTGGTFTNPSGTIFTFEPTVKFAGPPFKEIEEEVNHKLVISGAASAGNDGTFPVTGLVLDAVQYTNASGVVEADATVSWTIQKFDRDDNLLDGFKDAFWSRGDRWGHTGLPNSFIVILPLGCTTAIIDSVTAFLNSKRAAGTVFSIECKV